MKDEYDIRNEEMLLLGLCRLTFSKEQVAKISEVVGSITDWNYFAYLANEHGVAALAYHNLKQLGFLPVIPAEVNSLLKNALMLSLGRNAFHTETITGVLRILNSDNIRTVLLKGLALELSVYGNAGLRQMTDVDILLDRSQHIRARNSLTGHGYESMPVKSIFHKPIIAYSGKHLPSLVKNGTSIDIHLELFGGKRNVLTGLLFENSSEFRINDQKAFIPQPQLFFLYLVKHLFLHEMNNESQLRLYTDLVVMIEKYRDEIINYDLLTYAMKAGMTKILAWRLEPLRDLWGISFPDWINDFVDKYYNPESINKFIFFLKSPKNNPQPDKAKSYCNVIKEIPGLHRKFLFVAGDIFPTLSFMKKRYKAGSKLKAAFHYPHRLGKILWLIMK